MSAAVIQAIYNRLAGDTGAGTFHAAVAGQYWHLEAPNGTTPPLCVYAIDEAARIDLRYDNTDRHEWRVRFVIFVLNNDPTPDATALGIDAKLRTRLHFAELTEVSGYDRLVCLCESNGVATKDEDSVSVESVYRVFGTKTP